MAFLKLYIVFGVKVNMKKEESYTCSWCKEVFYELKQLKDHYKDKHNINDNPGTHFSF